ncbi:MAG: proteasome accessory factor PafA2 family protein [Candidatus Nanopelagicales bacterium]
MISVLRIMGIETECALLDARDPDADPGELAADLLFAYARAAAAEDGVAATAHVPARGSRQLLDGAGCRFDRSGEQPRADARGYVVDELPEEARTDQAPDAVVTGTRTMWVPRITDFESHHYRGSATDAPNGARLYVDHTHPKYAAPEALGPLAAARYDRAGDAVMVRAVAALNAQQPGRSAVVVKNNADGRGQAWGEHESCLMDRATDWSLITDVLTMSQTGAWDLAECELADPVAAVNAWNLDPKAPQPRVDGDRISCLELLEVALDRIGDWWQSTELSGTEPDATEPDATEPDATEHGATEPDAFSARTFELARRGVAALRTGDRSGVETELDWAIKHRVLAHVAASAPLGWADPKVARTELAFHDISRAGGLRCGLRTSGLMASWVDAAGVSDAVHPPPSGTRAQIRGAFVAACQRTGRNASIGWAHVRLDQPARPQVDLPDPLACESEEVRALIAEIEQLGPVGK